MTQPICNSLLTFSYKGIPETEILENYYKAKEFDKIPKPKKNEAKPFHQEWKEMNEKLGRDENGRKLDQ